MSTDWKALCAELLGELENEGHAHWPGGPDGDPLIEQTRAALAAEADGPAVPEGREPASVVGEPSNRMPTLNAIMQLADNYFTFRGNSHGDSFFATSIEANKDPAQSIYEFARAVLARYGHQPTPAEGEVAKLVVRLRRASDGASAMGWEQDSWTIARAADMLQQRHFAPVPVSERLPGPGDCDEEGFCWWFSPADPSAGTFGVAACWVLRKHEPEDDFRTHWLPATALPLPQGEVVT